MTHPPRTATSYDAPARTPPRMTPARPPHAPPSTYPRGVTSSAWAERPTRPCSSYTSEAVRPTVPELRNASRLEADPLTHERAQQVHGQLGVEEGPLRGVERRGGAVGRVDAGQQPLEGRHLLAGEQRDQRPHPHRRGPGAGDRPVDPVPLQGVQVAAVPRRRRVLVVAVGRPVRGRYAGAERPVADRERPRLRPRDHPPRGVAELGLAQRDRPSGTQHRRGDREVRHGHRTEQVHREPADQPGAVLLEPLERPAEQRGGRPTVLRVLAPRPCRGRGGAEPVVAEGLVEGQAGGSHVVDHGGPVKPGTDRFQVPPRACVFCSLAHGSTWVAPL